MTVRCLCACHVGGISALHVPPDVRDPVSAVTACRSCLNAHTPALVCKEWPIVPPPNPQLMPWMEPAEGRED